MSTVQYCHVCLLTNVSYMYVCEVLSECLILTVLVSLLLATNSAIPQGLFSDTLVPLIHPTPCHTHQCGSEQCDVMWRVSEW